ncbi:MAG: nitrilase family protein [Bacteroidales bacterium]|nr:nitrilase family protein [Bacteroidales bacterium]
MRITLIQSDLKWEDKGYNLHHLSSLMDSITQPTDIIVLPEMFTTAFSMKPEFFAEVVGGESLMWMQEQSRNRQAAIVGSFMVKEQGDYFNRLYFVKPDSSYEYYDKRHLFRMGNEQEHFSQGQKPLILDYKSWKIQTLICYDLRFPVWAKNQFQDGNYAYDACILVANWPAVRSQVWKTLSSARAIENQAYWIGVNRIGKDGNGLEHSGDSNIWDAKGESMIENINDNEFVKTLRISKSELDDFRSKFTVGLDWDPSTSLRDHPSYDFAQGPRGE